MPPVSKKAERSAAAVAASLEQLGDAAVESELNYVRSELEKQPQLAFTLGSLLRENKLTGLLEKPQYQPKVERLRSRVSKWKQLRAEHVSGILHVCAPHIFSREYLDSDDVHDNLLGCLCFGLNVTAAGKIPLREYPQCALVSELLKLCKARYEQCGNRFEGVDLRTFAGYYVVADDSVKCRVLPSLTYVLPFKEPDPDIMVENGYELAARLKSAKYKANLDLYEVFVELGGELLEEDAVWSLDGFVAAHVRGEYDLARLGAVRDADPEEAADPLACSRCLGRGRRCRRMW
jgi:hypothetical protein